MVTTTNPLLTQHISIIGDGEFMVPEGSYEASPAKGPNNMLQWIVLENRKKSKKYTYYAIPASEYDPDTRKPRQSA